MYSFIRSAYHFTLWILALASFITMTSCIKDNTDDCNTPDELLLYVKVVDTETGEDITRSGDMEEVILAMFDGEGRFIDTKLLDREQVVGRMPVVLTDFDTNGIQVSAWGNIGSSVDQSDPGNHSIGQEFLRLKTDTEGYNVSPDDFFFGLRKVALQARATQTEEVVITQKNSKINVTVRGLDHFDADDYYFIIEAPQSGYDFTGVPNTDPSRIKRTAVFDGNDLVSPTPYFMIHSADPVNVGPDDGATVRLIRKTGNADSEIAVGQRDADGNYIGLYPGKTTNVLIDITRTGNIMVSVVITDWRHVHMWPEW